MKCKKLKLDNFEIQQNENKIKITAKRQKRPVYPTLQKVSSCVCVCVLVFHKLGKALKMYSYIENKSDD